MAVRSEPWRQEGKMVGKLLHGASEQHVDRHVQDDQQADIGDPTICVQEACDKGSGKTHQRDRKGQPDDQDGRMLHSGAGDGQNVVERHRNVGDDDLPGGLREGLARALAGDGTVLVVIAVRQRFGRVALVVVTDAQLAPHFPAHPQKQKTAGDEQHGADAQQPLRDQGKDYAQDGGCPDADKDSALALIRGKAGRREADHNCVVAGEGEIDCDNLEES
ncbi:hypothetical protein MPLSOD_100114 [Mesorhizobium sp. SOD10]|nr:hypothetical protein MPLSOD_100114 [Mesorhizobium sp. SOD10]